MNDKTYTIEQIAEAFAAVRRDIDSTAAGRRKMARRDQLVAFTAWFAAGPGRKDTRIKVGVAAAEAEPVAAGARPGVVTEERRAWLREQIAQRR